LPGLSGRRERKKKKLRSRAARVFRVILLEKKAEKGVREGSLTALKRT